METLEAAAPAGTPKFVSDLDTLIRARYPLIYLVSWEEQRLDAILQDVAQTHGKALLQWSVIRGLRRMSGARTMAISEQSRDPVEALAAIAKLTEPSLVVLKDFHPFLDAPPVVRAMRELAQDLKSTYTTVILLAPVLTIPVELEKEVSVLDVPLPSFRDLFQLLREIVTVVRRGNKARVELTKDQAEQIIKAAQGLTLSEAENAFAKAIANDGVLDKDDIRLVLEEKRQVIRKSGLLEFVGMEQELAHVGGLDEIEKGLAGNAGAAVTDSGVSARVFGALLTWLQEKTAPVFVVATANRIDALPPELLRKGRFDEIFFIDLPSAAERREIFRIHIVRRERDPAAFDLDALSTAAEGFSGSEIEQAVIAGLYYAFGEQTELRHAHVLKAVEEAFPLSATMGEEISRLREWSKNRTRPASAAQRLAVAG